MLLKQNKRYTGSIGRIITAFGLACASAVMLFPTHASAITFDKIKIHGYFDVDYNQSTKPEGTSATSATKTDNGAFDFHHFSVLTDMEVTQELKIVSNLEFDHGPDTELGNGGIILEYAFGEYIFTDLARVRFGKVLTPFGLYNEIHDASPAFITASVPEVIYKADKMGGHSMMPKWMTGLNALGSGNIGHESEWDYVVYMGNGESLNTNESQFDSNPNKAVGGRIQYNAEDSLFLLGLSAFYGEKAVTESKLSEAHFAYVATLNVNLGNSNIRGEFAQSTLGSRTETAWYAQGSYTVGRFTPYARVQSIDPNDSLSDDHWRTYLGGLNVKLNDHLFFKIEWNEHTRGENNLGVIKKGNENFGEFRSVITVFY